MTGFSITPGTGAEDASGAGSRRASRSIVPPVIGRSVVNARCRARLGQCIALHDKKDVRVLVTVTAIPHLWARAAAILVELLWSFPAPAGWAVCRGSGAGDIA